MLYKTVHLSDEQKVKYSSFQSDFYFLKEAICYIEVNLHQLGLSLRNCKCQNASINVFYFISQCRKRCTNQSLRQ